VTILSDNYFGYCKKEVKSYISYSANLFGLCEEEQRRRRVVVHAVRPRPPISPPPGYHQISRTLAEGDDAARRPRGAPAGRARDRPQLPDILYVPENAHFDLPSESVRWTHEGQEQKLKLRHRHTYVLPSGFKVHLEKPRGSRTWRLRRTHAECTLCHKPSTVSGGGKSEISRALNDAIIQGRCRRRKPCSVCGTALHSAWGADEAPRAAAARFSSAL